MKFGFSLVISFVLMNPTFTKEDRHQLTSVEEEFEEKLEALLAKVNEEAN